MNSSPISSWPRLAVVLGLLAASPVSRAASVTWSGSANDLWSNSANWSAAVPGSADTAVFSGAGNGNTNINTGSIPIFQISFSTANAAAYTIGSLTDSITLNNNGGILMDSAVANNQLINANVVMGPGIASGNYYLTNESTTNNLTVAGSVQGGTTTGTAGVKTLNVGGAGATRINGILDKGGATNLYLVKNGLGTLTLAGTGSEAEDHLELAQVCPAQADLRLGKDRSDFELTTSPEAASCWSFVPKRRFICLPPTLINATYAPSCER